MEQCIFFQSSRSFLYDYWYFLWLESLLEIILITEFICYSSLWLGNFHKSKLLSVRKNMVEKKLILDVNLKEVWKMLNHTYICKIIFKNIYNITQRNSRIFY